MRVTLARLLHAAADRLAGQTEADGLRLKLRLREMEVDSARQLVQHWRQRAQSESRACERYIAERDEALSQATLWLGTVDACNTVIARQGAALARRPSAEIARPMFGRRPSPPHLRPVD